MNRLDTLAPPADHPDSPVAESQHASPFRHINVGQRERAVSIAAGGALAALGLLRGRLSGLALAGLGAWIIKRGLDGHCALYESLGINTAMEDHADPGALYEHGVKIYETVTVNRPAQELYDFWRDFQNHPRFMPNVEAVSVDGDRSR